MVSAAILLSKTPNRRQAVLSVILILSLFTIHAIAYSQTCSTSNQDLPLQIQCGKNNSCVVKARLHSGKYKKIYSGYTRSPRWHVISGKLVQYTMSCGSPCTVSIFTNLDTGEVSEALQDVLAIDGRHMVVAIASGSTIQIQPMFSEAKTPIILKRQFSPVASLVSAIEDIHFTPSGALSIQYLAGSKYASKQEVIKLNLDHFR